MMLPSIFGGSLFDEFMSSPWDKRIFGGKHLSLVHMKKI